MIGVADTFSMLDIDLFTTLFQHSPVGISVITMDGRIVQANPTLCAMLGYSAEELCQLTIDDLDVAPSSSQGFLREAADDRNDGDEIEKLVRLRDGGTCPIRLRRQILRNAAGEAMYSLAHVEDRRAELLRMQDLERLASTDPATGIANQRGLEQFLARTPGPHRVAVFEIANYRVVAAGATDTSSQTALAFEVIRRLAASSACPVTAFAPLVARLNHSSFMIGFDLTWSEAHAEAAIERSRAELSQAFLIGDTPTTVQFAIGFASSSGDNVEATILNAATAAEISRQSLDGSIVVYGDTVTRPANDRRRRATELASAIEAGALRTAIQPIVDIRTHAVIGAEALARWTHPTDGDVSPMVFIPIAEESNALYALTRLVMGDALRFIKTAPAPQTRISVNVTSSLIESPTFADDVLEMLEMFGLDASVLCLELTESMIVRALPLAERQVGRLAEHGVRWSLDDFGTGYSSLSRLVELPFTEIKIDRHFVAGALTDRRYRAVVEGAVGLGRSMDLDVVAEGVETLDQARLMRELGVHHAQGFLFGRPQLHVRD
jgi:PAS domain S-box-containing protein